MADKPLYYGSSKGMPKYYGGTQPAYGGVGAAGAYGSYGSYGAYGSYGSYGAYGSYGGTGRQPGGEEESLVGSITLGRMLRVISQRWLSVFVFLLVGLIVSFTVYKVSPTIYEAKSEFTMDVRRNFQRQGAVDMAMPYYGDNYAEIFNTRLSAWRSDKIVLMIIEAYQTDHPAAAVTDDEIRGALAGSMIELQRNSRIINITVRSRDPKLAADLANAYAHAIEAMTEEDNKNRCDKAVVRVHATAEKKRREVDKLSSQILELRSANKVDSMKSLRETTQQALQKTNADILSLEAQETQLVEWEKALEQVQQYPESFGSLPSGTARLQEIAAEYKLFLDASAELAKLRLAFTDNHPEVVVKISEQESAKQRFLKATERALETGRSNLQTTRNQLSSLRTKRQDLQGELSSLEQKIAIAETEINKIDIEFTTANDVLKNLTFNENQLRLEAEADNEIVSVGRPAKEPHVPVLPNPLYIFGVGIALSLALGILFVLVIDNLEDTVVNLADIEGRLALKVLAVFPHVRRKKREEVAKFLVEDKYSQFSEAVAGLRNLLDSPRYEAMSHCLLVISTQPGEGKTITSTSIAISYAQANKKVLHVDFDMRRPRLAHVWGLDLPHEKSFSHTLQNAGDKIPDFASLVNHSNVPGLDVIASLPPEGVSPATIFGSQVIPAFFEWARANYDRIIVDSPPFGLVGDVVSLAVMVDSVIVMCCPDRTHFKPILYCSRSLTEAGANILGVVVNDVEVSSASAFSLTKHHDYGYGYGRYGGYAPSKGRKRAGDGDNVAAEDGETRSPRESSVGDSEDFVDED